MHRNISQRIFIHRNISQRIFTYRNIPQNVFIPRSISQSEFIHRNSYTEYLSTGFSSHRVFIHMNISQKVRTQKYFTERHSIWTKYSQELYHDMDIILVVEFTPGSMNGELWTSDVQFYFYSRGYRSITSALIYSLFTAHHLCLVSDGGRVDMYARQPLLQNISHQHTVPLLKCY